MNKTFKRMMHMALALLLALSLAAPALATEASAPAAEETPAAPVAQITEAPAEAPVDPPVPAAEETPAAPAAQITEAPAETPAPAAEETTAAPAAQITEAPAEAPVETPAPAAEETTAAPVAQPSDEPAAEPAEAPVETPAPITEEELPANARLMAVLQDTLNAQRSVSIYAVYDGEFLSFGDQVTFVALLRGYDNLTYTLQWQWSQDNLIWEDVPGAEQATYSFQVAEDNYQNFWRVGVTITGVIVPDELAAAAQ
ncbi:MAG: hypothetical protein SOX25_09755 [Eubacteriales bacterium]|nr:hypothetical protein [Eubacteriales bacterium]